MVPHLGSSPTVLPGLGLFPTLTREHGPHFVAALSVCRLRSDRLCQDGRAGRRGRFLAARPGRARCRHRRHHAALSLCAHRQRRHRTDRLSFTVPLGDRQVAGRLWLAAAGVEGAGLSRRAGGLFRPRRSGPGPRPLPVHAARRRPLGLCRQRPALRVLFPGRAGGGAAARFLARRPARQRLADGAGAGLSEARSIARRPATSCAAARKRCGRCARFTTLPIRECSRPRNCR